MPKVRGEAHPSAKLTEEKVRELRQLRTEGLSYEKLGYLFGITTRSAWQIVKGIHWKHVPDVIKEG